MFDFWDPFGDTVGCAPRTFRGMRTNGVTFDFSNEEQAFGNEVHELESMGKELQSRNEIPSHDFSATAGDCTLKHDVLDEPEKQIRLLSRSPQETWHLSTWNIETAPSYAALSYEWGSMQDSRQLIRVDNYSLPVTPSCALALRQLWRCTEYDYFWIDAICIDQTHPTEKGHQVQAMADIYTRAKCTLVSLGAHDAHSLQLYNAIRSLDPANSVLAVSGLDAVAAEKLLLALAMVGQREYWHRLWVYQELILSKDLQILCGRDVVEWKSFVGLLEQFGRCFENDRELGGTFCAHSDWSLRGTWRGRIKTGYTTLKTIHDRRSVTNGASVERPDLYQLLEITRERKCLDIRDKVFGVMRLVEWPENIGVVPVNYQDPPIKVAIDVLRHYPSRSFNAVSSAATLVKCLNITGIESMALLQKPIDLLAAASLCTSVLEIARSTYLHGIPGGHLGGNFYMPDYGNMLSTISSKQTTIPSSAHYRRLLGRDDQVAGVISAECRPGDVLMELADNMHIVFRIQGKYNFEFVGHAVLKPEARVDWDYQSSDSFDKARAWRTDPVKQHFLDSGLGRNFDAVLVDGEQQGESHLNSAREVNMYELHQEVDLMENGTDEDSTEVQALRDEYETQIQELEQRTFQNPEEKILLLSTLRESYVVQLIAIQAYEDQKGTDLRYRQVEYEVQIDACALLLWCCDRQHEDRDIYVGSCNLSALQRCRAQMRFGARAILVERLVDRIGTLDDVYVEELRMMGEYEECEMRSSGAVLGFAEVSASGTGPSRVENEGHLFGKSPVRSLGNGSLLSAMMGSRIGVDVDNPVGELRRPSPSSPSSPIESESEPGMFDSSIGGGIDLPPPIAHKNSYGAYDLRWRWDGAPATRPLRIDRGGDSNYPARRITSRQDWEVV